MPRQVTSRANLMATRKTGLLGRQQRISKTAGRIANVAVNNDAAAMRTIDKTPDVADGSGASRSERMSDMGIPTRSSCVVVSYRSARTPSWLAGLLGTFCVATG